MKHPRVNPASQTKVKRQKNKMARKRGLMFLESIGKDPVAFGQEKDPLFKIKGIKRFRSK